MISRFLNVLSKTCTKRLSSEILIDAKPKVRISNLLFCFARCYESVMKVACLLLKKNIYVYKNGNLM